MKKSALVTLTVAIVIAQVTFAVSEPTAAPAQTKTPPTGELVLKQMVCSVHIQGSLQQSVHKKPKASVQMVLFNGVLSFVAL